MTTALAADLNGSGTYQTKTRMRSVLIDRAAARRSFDAIVSTPRAGLEFVVTQARRLGLDRAWRYLTGKARWVGSVLHVAGSGNLAVLAATTHEGRSGVRIALHVAASIIALPFRLLLAPFAFAARHTGAPGRKVTTAVTVGYCVVRDKVNGAIHTADCWMADHHDHPVMQMLRSWVTISIVRRLVARFVPSGWWRIAAYAAAVVTLPDPGFDGESGLLARTDTALRKAIDRTKGQAAERAEITSVSSEATPTPENGSESVSGPGNDNPDGRVLRLGDRKTEWTINGYSPSRDAFTVSIDRNGIREVIRVHPQHDGTMVYQFGKSLYVGRVPADVDHEAVAEAIAAAQAAVDDAPAPTNRGARRAQERAAKRGQ